MYNIPEEDIKQLQSILSKIRWDFQTNNPDNFELKLKPKKETIYIIFQDGLKIEMKGIIQSLMEVNIS